MFVDGVQVGSFTATTTMASYSFAATIGSTSVVRVEFTNDAPGRNITVDAIEADGVRYESEAASTFSVGVWTSSTGCAAGFKQNERLACNGYLEYEVSGGGTTPPPTTPPPTTPPPTTPPASTGTLVVIAEGDSGVEQADVLVNGVRVGSFTATTTMASYSFAATVPNGAVVRVEFLNDAPGRNLTVDAIETNGVRYESEAPSTYSVGVWTSATGCAGGFKLNERLACNGYLEYNITSGPAPTTPSAPSTALAVIARGDQGGEQAEVFVNGTQVGSFTATTAMATYTFTAPAGAGSVVRVEFVNDAPGLNLTVDAIEANGVRYESEAPSTFSVGVWTSATGCAAGFKQS